MVCCDVHIIEQTTAASDWLKLITKCVISDTVIFYDTEPNTVLGVVFFSFSSVADVGL